MQEADRRKLEGLSSIVNAWVLVTNAASRRCPAPAVSVVVTLYNYSEYIVPCLDSVAASTTDGLPGGIEVVVVDDGSTDASARIVEEYMHGHSMPIRLAKKIMNSGVADARNAGLSIARAPYVFILDADNEIRPACLSAHYRALAASDHAVVYSYQNRFDGPTGRSLGVAAALEWSARELVSRPYIDAMAMVRKTAVLEVGGYSTEYGRVLPQGWEDYDLWLKLAQANHTGQLIPEVLGDYRVHSRSMSYGMDRQRELAVYFSRKFHLLVNRFDDLPQLFGIPRRELAIVGQQAVWARPDSPPRTPTVAHRLLGPKMCRSICKRLAAAYCWFAPT